MSGPEARGPGRRALAESDRLVGWTVAQQRLQALAEIDRLEALGGRRDLVGAPPTVIERPALLAVVEARRVDLAGVRAAEEELLAMLHELVAPLHGALTRPDVAHIPYDEPGFLARLTHGGLGEFLPWIDQAA